MNQVFLIPKEGVLVRDSHGQTHIPAEGAYRMMNSYYDRRVRDGDLIMRESGSPSAPPASIEKPDGEKAGSEKTASRKGDK